MCSLYKEKGYDNSCLIIIRSFTDGSTKHDFRIVFLQSVRLYFFCFHKGIHYYFLIVDIKRANYTSIVYCYMNTTKLSLIYGVWILCIIHGYITQKDVCV